MPVAAVQTDQSGSYRPAGRAGHKVAQQPVTLGAQIAQNFIVEKGLSGGESVIIAGVQKVKPGEMVDPVSTSPAPAAAGTPGVRG